MVSRERRTSTITQRDWSLHRQGSQDEARHNEKVKEAIKDNLPTIISDGTIITANPDTKRIIKIPLKSLDLPHIRHKIGDEGVGGGQGNEQEGDVIDTIDKNDPTSKKAGNQPGIEYYEAELTIEELQQLVFADMKLPFLQPKKNPQVESETYVVRDIRRNRSPSGLDMIRTIEANLKRNAEERHKAEIGGIIPEDYRVRRWEKEIKEETTAVLIAMRDISGSMGDFENYIARTFCWWTRLFLQTEYPSVTMLFIVHDTTAQEVTEDKFFERGSGGGTICSSANKLALEIMENRYHPDIYNIYGMHFSDGENLNATDNNECVRLLQKQLELGINQYAYVQIARYNSGGGQTLLTAYHQDIHNPRFHAAVVSNKEQVWPTLQGIFDPNKTLSAA